MSWRKQTHAHALTAIQLKALFAAAITAVVLLVIIVVLVATITTLILDAVLALVSAALEAGAAHLCPIIFRLCTAIGGFFTLGTAATIACLLYTSPSPRDS